MATPTPSDLPTNRKTAWSRKVLIPLWTLQIAGALLTIGGCMWYLGDYDGEFGLSYSYTSSLEIHHLSRATFGYVSAIILIFLWAIALAIIAFQIVRYHKKNLPAKTMLTSQYILGVFATICFLIEFLGLFGIIRGGYKTFYDFLGVVIATLTIWGTMIYTGVIRHRRKLAKRESKNTYGMTDFDGEAGPGKNNARVEVAN
ncbi:hypothetical protein D6D19_01800 [Aureobasidium pullulans]|uniref:Uncharacterized protein n=1 Tax=Aureobasidium pullulans TaxID=5580 RepID=A0A4S9WLT2_AURPU|nr:hypothetical protein D6D19_01800 [Aureobasidium pullulans]THY23127.1 hypothetical protein D6D00_06429 [Aureobasidium pullulans]THZ66495.1 hypothetical protein D6C85_08083 [Aureobasidium pullulans]